MSINRWRVSLVWTTWCALPRDLGPQPAAAAAIGTTTAPTAMSIALITNNTRTNLLPPTDETS
jgi:hypothetical protein